MAQQTTLMVREWELLADLAMELIQSAYGRGDGQSGLDDPAIRTEALAVAAIKRGDMKGIEKWRDRLKAKREEEFDILEKVYGAKK